MRSVAIGLPITVAAVAIAFGVAGCAKKTLGIDAGETTTNVGARLPSAPAKTRIGHSERGARIASAPTMALIELDDTRPTMTNTLLQLFGDQLAPGDRPLPNNGLCPHDMASIEDRFCVDKYEGSLLEILPNGEERGWSPYNGVEGHIVRAVSEPGVYPQAYISANQAKEACAHSGKRLCKPAEWRSACMGPEKTTYGYGSTNEPGRCNDHGRSPIGAMGFNGADPQTWTWPVMNQPELNQLEGTLAKSGEHEGCTNEYGVYDMVGNIHEWVDDPEGTFLGGYYQDIHQNGDGCQYRTMAHEAWYHDYSTGFRCCADVAQ